MTRDKLVFSVANGKKRQEQHEEGDDDEDEDGAREDEEEQERRMGCRKGFPRVFASTLDWGQKVKSPSAPAAKTK